MDSILNYIFSFIFDFYQNLSKSYKYWFKKINKWYEIYKFLFTELNYT